MAYEMKGNKKPGSTYKDQMAFADKGLYGPTDDGAHDGPGDDKSMDKGIKDRFTDPMYTVTKKKSGKTKVISVQKQAFQKAADKAIQQYKKY